MSHDGNTDLLESYYEDAKAIVNPLLSEEKKKDFCIDYAWDLLMQDERYKPTVQVSQNG
tara:strand:+ start:324 stop:500 length:177 start_codon:yes stop_codon:yes gene_type:complete